MTQEELSSQIATLKEQFDLGWASEKIVTYTTAVKLVFGAVQLVAMTELYLKIRAIYSQKSLTNVYKLRRMFYVGILLFAIISFISALSVSRKGDKTINLIVYSQLTDVSYRESIQK